MHTTQTDIVIVYFFSYLRTICDKFCFSIMLRLSRLRHTTHNDPSPHIAVVTPYGILLRPPEPFGFIIDSWREPRMFASAHECQLVDVVVCCRLYWLNSPAWPSCLMHAALTMKLGLA